ncbi:thymidine kinase [bacterium]|nr:thymidine kinase [bacterium]
MGRIELIIGCMYSGKTTEFMRQIMMYKTLSKKIIILTHSNDNRYSQSGNISTHNREMMDAVATTSLNDIVAKTEYKEAQVVFIEEAQFFPDLFDFTIMAANQDNKIVVVCGLDGDFQLNPFEQVLRLVTHSESVKKLNALCKKCGDGTPACFSKRIVTSQERELVGSDGVYEALCRKHYYS